MFEKYLPLSERSEIKSAAEAGEDETSERQMSANIKLFS